MGKAKASAAVATPSAPDPAADVPAPELAKSPADAPAPAPPKVTPPTMGRVVLFTSDGHTAPAMVTGVDDDGTLALEVFYRDGVAGSPKRSCVPHLSDGHGWHWPPRV